jgi:hypothetical protein
VQEFTLRVNGTMFRLIAGEWLTWLVRESFLLTIYWF